MPQIVKDKFICSLLFAFLFYSFSFSQNTYDIVFPGKDEEQKCKNCFELFEQKPEDVEFSIIREHNDLFFQVNNLDWFNRLFANAGDGLAVDIVVKDKYSCDLEAPEIKEIRGTLLKPVYAKSLKSKLEMNSNNIYQVNIGKIPKKLAKENLEYNILFLSDKYLCRYYVIYDLKSYDWDLLDMGMFLDELTFTPKQIQSTDNQSYVVRNKALKFTVPFRKNKSTYSQADIKPIYESLRLTDFNIKAVDIKAYASIEGISGRNAELQQLRANSVVKALQTYQKAKIETNISTSDNWVEFFNDIEGTKYEYLKDLSKSEIKKKLDDGLSKQMEPILKNHRKAVLELELEKKDKYSTASLDDLFSKFNKLIGQKDIEDALEVQNSIFERLKQDPKGPESLSRMFVPKEKTYIEVLNKNSAFKYMSDFTYALITYKELQELEKMAPNNGAIKYNLVALRLKLWHWNAAKIDKAGLNTDIYALEKYGIPKPEITRMMVNFHIILAEEFLTQGDHTSKDNSVTFVNNNYKKFTLSSSDYLSLAQFFNEYGTPSMAIDLLDTKARSIDIDEDLLFYYLNLTLIDKELTKDQEYRTVMLNAININQERFCRLFNSVDNGGVTFQLLENGYLRIAYCENCRNQN